MFSFFFRRVSSVSGSVLSNGEIVNANKKKTKRQNRPKLKSVPGIVALLSHDFSGVRNENFLLGFFRNVDGVKNAGESFLGEPRTQRRYVLPICINSLLKKTYEGNSHYKEHK